MVKLKCEICSDEIEKGFMDKIIGTSLKIKNGDKSNIVYVCSFCQKKYGDDIKNQV